MASFIQYNDPVTDNFFTTVDRFSRNTMAFENHCTLERYQNEDLKHVKETESDLFYYYNIILEKYKLRIMEKAIDRAIGAEEIFRYDMNPYLCSYELLNSVDYWWLILLVNNKLSIYDFTNLPSVLKLPDMTDLKNLLKYEMNVNQDFGKIIL